jgi:radical SAM/Cys-rich protein
MNDFETQIQKDCGLSLYTDEVSILQVNTGLKCNMHCAHCHFGCGPQREEVMDWKTASRVVEVAQDLRPEVVDITGGAPEIHPHFERFVSRLRDDGQKVKVRTNLTAILERGLAEVSQFLKDHKVHLVASMPCYLEENVCQQRGQGVYEKSVQVLQKLNSIGYGKDPELPLDLVYNPIGPFLPPNQTQLENDYKRELHERFGIEFARLLTITNMPIGRFWESLKNQRKDQEYMQLLLEGFNCQTVDGLMCRHQICVAWDGRLYDCDFNIALDLPVGFGAPNHIRDFNSELLASRKIVTGKHCFGCTAGFGSSCGGALATGNS